jgi:aminoglycoside phosphotransferase (APT) family kinase protein
MSGHIDQLSTHELAAVTRALTQAGAEPASELRATLIAGGRSNLTFRLYDGTSQWVLRMPPRVGRTPSAHDVAREYRVVAALAGTPVPVAKAVALCDDEAVVGFPFAIVEFVSGETIQRREDLDALDERAIADVTTELVAVLAGLHAVDFQAIGLAGLGQANNYAERQLKRWVGQWAIVGETHLQPLVSTVIDDLARSVPRQHRASIVHGDYRIDNTLIDTSEPSLGARIAAVIDWELSTLGDPVADVAMMCAYRDTAFDLILGSQGAWTSDRLPDVAGLAAAYERVTGDPLLYWEFHLGLAYFKIGVIAAGIDHRFRAGSGSGSGFDTSGGAVARYFELARDAVRT